MEVKWTIQVIRTLFLSCIIISVLSNVCWDVPESSRRDCLANFRGPNDEIMTTECAVRHCHWCVSQTRDVPWCFIPQPDSCSLPVERRIDCIAFAPNTKEGCLNKGCTWCPTTLPNVPWCYYTDGHRHGGEVCPADLPERDRIDCFPFSQHPSKDGCLARDCYYCQSWTSGVPWCFLDSRNWPKDVVPEKERLDCMINGGDVNPAECVARGCLYRQNSIGAPWCYIPRHQGYTIDGSPVITDKGYRITLRRTSTLTMYSEVKYVVQLDVEFQTDHRLRLKFTDPYQKRFEVPLDISSPGRRAAHPLYDIEFNTDGIFYLKVKRKDTGVTIFDTSIGGLIFEDQFLQIATRLPSSNVYGFGEHEHPSYRHDLNWKTWGMFSRDQPPMEGANLYGVYPYYTVLEDNGDAHSVLFLNSAAQDVQMMPAPALSYRTIGGILDLYIFLGPTPENVVQQFTEAVGRPFMPPYWSLGFSLGKYGYHTLDNMKQTIDRMRHHDIPQDYQFGDIDYMDRSLDFTYSNDRYHGLPQYVKDLKEDGVRFIIILDPAIANGIDNYRPHILGQEKNIWVKYNDGRTPVEGKVWPPTNVNYPDFTFPNTTNWWVTLCDEFHHVIDYDGLWIDMNEPSNFVWGSVTGCAHNNINHPPYFPRIWGPNLYYKSLCPDHVHHIGKHNEVHSLYGWSQAKPTLKAARKATGKRSIVLSRSVFPGAGKYAAHWLGDNWSRWSNMKFSITGLFEANMFGIPFVGADICGFIRNTDYEMCLRWQQLGAFYPFSRNHNLGYENRDQDPAVFGDDFARIARDKLRIRYTLLPYLYTLFHHSHSNGSTVVRPLLNEFRHDPATYSIDKQFLWGRGLLISPVLEYNARSVWAYFPDARWYSYYDGKEVGVRKQWINLNAPLDFIPLHVRGGSVLPTQEPHRSTKWSRQNPMGLIAALDDNGEAHGDLFWDDGESTDTFENGLYYLAAYHVSGDRLTGRIIHSNFQQSLRITTIRLFGSGGATWTKVNSQDHSEFTWNADRKELTISGLNIGLSTEFSVTWGS